MTRMSHQEKSLLQFGPYRIDPAQHALFSGDRLIPLQPKVFDTLLVLAETQGRVVEKEELVRRVWPDTFVEEGSLARNVSTLRKLLGETPDGKAYIETIPKRGYRFTAEVIHLASDSPEPFIENGPRNDYRFGEPIREPGAAEQVLDAKQRSMVVLPFVNLSGEPDQEYFSDGLTEEITNALASIRGLRVVARTTAFQFKGKNLDVRTIGSRVGAEAVLEGSVRRQGDRLRITAQFINARDGYHHWSRAWEKELRDVFEVQQEIAHRVALELRLEYCAADQTALPPTQNMEAYNLYLRGLYLANRLLIAEAAEVFEQAVSTDPNFADAHAALAYQYSLLGYTATRRPAEAYTIATRHATRAIELSPSLPHALFSKGWISTFYDWDWIGAERYLKAAIAGNQNTGGAHHAYAHFLVAMDRFSEALAESQQVLVEEPCSPTLNGHMIWHHLYSGRPDLAIPQALHALEIDPLLKENMRYLRWAYEATRSYEDAIRTVERQHSADVASNFRIAFESRGEEGYWETWLDHLLADRRASYSSPYEIATIAAKLDRNKEAVDWLRTAFDERDSWIVYLKVDPKLNNVRAEAGVQELIAKLRLP